MVLRRAEFYGMQSSGVSTLALQTERVVSIHIYVLPCSERIEAG